MANRFLVAAVQMNASADKLRNRERTEVFVAAAASAGAALVALPEMFFWRGKATEEHEAAEPIPGPTTDFLAELARRFRVYLLGGSILERNELPRPFNTSVFLSPSGEIIGVYRKVHLFDVHLPGRIEIQESARRQAGGRVIVITTDLGRFGMAICYDLRFPELFRALVARGAEMVFLPSAFTFMTGAAHWHPLVRARAIENQVYLLAPDQIGRAEDGVPNYGHSAIVDPWGTVLAEARDEETVIVAEVDLEYLRKVRTELPCLQHIRFVLPTEPS